MTQFKCAVCDDRTRVPIVSKISGKTQFMDCPACKPLGLRLQVKELKRALFQSRVATVILGIAAVIGIIGMAR